MRKKYILSLILCLNLLVFSLFGIIPASAETGVDFTIGGNNVPLQVWNPTDELGMYINITAEFIGMDFSMPTWSTSGVYSTTISCYKWDKNYEKTMMSQPICEKRFTSLIDNASNRLDFQNPLPAGEYLFLIHNSDGNVGCWSFPETNSTTVTYFNGEIIDYSLRGKVYFKGESPENPFGTLGSDESYGICKKYSEILIPERDFGELNIQPDSMYLTHFADSNFYISENAEITLNNSKKSVAYYSEVLPENTDDLEKFIKKLSNYSIDAIFTNFDSEENSIKVLNAICKVQKNGFDAPKISFIFTSDISLRTIKQFYLSVYRDGLYNSAWFYFNNKPLLLSNSRSYNLNLGLEKEIFNFFEFRQFEPKNSSLYNNDVNKVWNIAETGIPNTAYYSMSDKSFGNPEHIGFTVDGNSDENFKYAIELSPEILTLTGNIDSRVFDYICEFKGYCESDGYYAFPISNLYGVKAEISKNKLILNIDSSNMSKININLISEKGSFTFTTDNNICEINLTEIVNDISDVRIKFNLSDGKNNLPADGIYCAFIGKCEVFEETTVNIQETNAETETTQYVNETSSEVHSDGCKLNIGVIIPIVILPILVFKRKKD